MLRPKHSGFSLVELMVATGLFATVMALATGAYLLMINVSRETQAVATGINNLSYALEYMSRNIMTGRAYQACPDGDISFAFTNATGQRARYSLVAGAIHETLDTDRDGTLADETSVAITEPLVTIDALSFTCTGTYPRTSASGGTTDAIQANVRLGITGRVSAGPEKERTLYVQTLVTMRAPDL